MSVYFIHSPETELCKVGFAKTPWSRLGKMQVDSPTRLVLLAVEEGGKEIEAQRHEQFAELRVRGEWFKYDGALKAHVASLPPFQAAPRSRVVTQMAEDAGISTAYASQLMSGQRASIEVMLHVFTVTGWKAPIFEGADEDTLRLLSQRFPYKRAAA